MCINKYTLSIIGEAVWMTDIDLYTFIQQFIYMYTHKSQLRGMQNQLFFVFTMDQISLNAVQFILFMPW